MSGSGGFAVSRTHAGDRFYNPPAIRRHQQFLLQQQQQRLQRQFPTPVKSEAAVVEADTWTDSDDSTTTLSKPPSVFSSSPSRPAMSVTNLDRLVESVTPFVPAQFFSEVNAKGWRNRESDMQPYFCLGDLWESLREWSVYGVGVPLLLNWEDSIIQYYVPYLSGIQLYVDPAKSPARLSHGIVDLDVLGLIPPDVVLGLISWVFYVRLKKFAKLIHFPTEKILHCGLWTLWSQVPSDLIGSYSVKVVGFRGLFARIQIIPLGTKQK
ncbi:hypothetical protein TEA_018978 [Camellia sinensis var. sinensis]|uniref:Uncharacterized protein n=1 Tax=Camellia sinensis var. sinensis TaxID=542762 RepID=A0A4V3WLJ6_CAMSN|nr:hypothetical protein TEA_018978 [Camellia sinensis var. sinensis]